MSKISPKDIVCEVSELCTALNFERVFVFVVASTFGADHKNKSHNFFFCETDYYLHLNRRLTKSNFKCIANCGQRRGQKERRRRANERRIVVH
jgi:hypothetical protein